jgi:enterochelin esterase-like enzyme
MLHGQADLNDQWIRIGLTTAADELISNHQIMPLIIVFPYEITWRLQPDESLFDEALIEEVLPYVESSFNACKMRFCRAIGGLSRGGNWAVYLGFKHPELFTAVGAHSAPLFFGEIARIDIAAELLSLPGSAPNFYIDVGSKDPQRQNVLDFVQALDNNHIPYTLAQYPGYHDERYWGAHVKEYLEWYSNQFEIGTTK